MRMETRAILTREEFVQLATTPESDGWLTGRFMLFRPEINAIVNWQRWDAPENRLLTEAQRSLYALSSAIYYAHRSGGIVDWFEEEISCWGEIVRLLSNVQWPEFSARFLQAMQGQTGGGRTLDEAMKAWNRRRENEHERMLKQTQKILRQRLGKETNPDEEDLCTYAMIFASQGEMSLPNRVSDAASEFGNWVRLGAAKKESVVRVSTWLLANEQGLRRPD
jgi:hypothetical protein